MSGKIVAGFGLFIAAFGVWMLASPTGVAQLLEGAITPVGLGVGAAFRVTLGVLLWVASGVSRTPRTFKVLGVLIVIGALAVVALGVEGIHGIWEWSVARGDAYLRFDAAAAVAMGAFFMWSTLTTKNANPLPGDE
jgi:hypothetical protein